MITRRNFAVFGVASIATASIGPSILLAQSQTFFENSADVRPDLAFNSSGITVFPRIPLNGTREKANTLLNKKFYIQFGDSGVLETELIQITDHESTMRTEGFSMMFFTLWEPKLVEGMYRIEVPALGHFPLYLEPVETLADGYFYEASTVHLVRNAL